MTTRIQAPSSPVVPNGSPVVQNEPNGIPDNPLPIAAKSEAVMSTGTRQKEAKINTEQLEELLNNVKQTLPSSARNLQFSIDEGSGRTVVKVVDSNTKEVIRQIPSEEILAIAESLSPPKGFLIKQDA